MAARPPTLLYALPGLALAVPMVPVSVLLPSFYATELGLGFATTGLVLMLARLSDLFTDPLIGRWCDRTESRFGRRRPFMLVGGLIALVALFALAAPTQSSSAVWLLGFSMLLYLGWTLVAIPYQTLAAELTTDYHQRSRLTGARELAGLVGITLAVGLPALAGQFMTLPTNPLAPVALLTVLLGVPGFALFLRGVREPAPATRYAPVSDRAPQASGVSRVSSLLDECRRMRREGPFFRLLGAWFINGLANGLPAVLLPVYLTDVLGLGPTARYGFLSIYVLASMVGLPLWIALSRRLGKHHAWMLAMLVASVGFAPALVLGSGDAAGFAAICVVTGICLGADLALPPAMQADVADLDRHVNGRDRTALLFGWWSLSAKFATALAVGVAFGVLGTAAGGLEASTVVPGSTVADPDTVRWLYAGLPVALKLTAVLMLRGYPLDAGAVDALNARWPTQPD